MRFPITFLAHRNNIEPMLFGIAFMVVVEFCLLAAILALTSRDMGQPSFSNSIFNSIVGSRFTCDPIFIVSTFSLSFAFFSFRPQRGGGISYSPTMFTHAIGSPLSFAVFAFTVTFKPRLLNSLAFFRCSITSNHSFPSFGSAIFCTTSSVARLTSGFAWKKLCGWQNLLASGVAFCLNWFRHIHSFVMSTFRAIGGHIPVFGLLNYIVHSPDCQITEGK